MHMHPLKNPAGNPLGATPSTVYDALNGQFVPGKATSCRSWVFPATDEKALKPNQLGKSGLVKIVGGEVAQTPPPPTSGNVRARGS